MESLRVSIDQRLLVWARETRGYAKDAAARRLGVSRERLGEWEAGSAQLTIKQLRHMADAYGRPLAVLFLPDVPKGFHVGKDFRRLGGTSSTASPSLALAIRRAMEVRDTALALADDTNTPLPAFVLTAALGDDPPAVAARLRRALGIDLAAQTAWADPYVALRGWRDAIEHSHEDVPSRA